MISLIAHGTLGATLGFVAGLHITRDTGSVTRLLAITGLVATVALKLFTTLPVTLILTICASGIVMLGPGDKAENFQAALSIILLGLVATRVGMHAHPAPSGI